MPRKPVTEGGKREEITKAALELFFTKGYDGTSVRNIMCKAGGEVGLFYYYFKNKDDVFDAVLNLFFAHYDADFAKILEHGRRNPCRLMEDFFAYMELETAVFREKYAAQMHRTVRWAIREHTLEIIEPYLQQVVAIQSSYYGVVTAIAPDAAALYLTYGVGSSILHEPGEHFLEQRAEVKRGSSLLMGMPVDEQELRIPYPANAADISGCIQLVEQVPLKGTGMMDKEFEKILAERIMKGEAWVFRDKEKIAAFLLYSRKKYEIDFLAVSPEYEKWRMDEKLLETAAAQFSVGTELTLLCMEETRTVTTSEEPLRL